VGDHHDSAGNRGRKQSSAALQKALTHPMRMDILLKLQERGRLSPVRYSAAEQVKVSVASYHFKVLQQHGVVEVVEVNRAGPSLEQLYSIDADSALGGFLSRPRPGEDDERQTDEDLPEASN
jgi:DNA-binding transcriptional ArsR family regulator